VTSGEGGNGGGLSGTFPALQARVAAIPRVKTGAGSAAQGLLKGYPKVLWI